EGSGVHADPLEVRVGSPNGVRACLDVTELVRGERTCQLAREVVTGPRAEDVEYALPRTELQRTAVAATVVAVGAPQVVHRAAVVAAGSDGWAGESRNARCVDARVGRREVVVVRRARLGGQDVVAVRAKVPRAHGPHVARRHDAR